MRLRRSRRARRAGRCVPLRWRRMTSVRALACPGGTANVDGGTGLLEVLPELPATTHVACDVDVPLLDAVRVFAAQKGATAEQLPELEQRLRPLGAYADLPGAGAAGGLGAA